MKAMLKTATGLALVAALAACGGGGGGSSSDAGSGSAETTLVTKANYVDVAGMTLVAGDRLKRALALAHLGFEHWVEKRSDCERGGTLTSTGDASYFEVVAANCVALIDGEIIEIPDGRMELRNTTTLPLQGTSKTLLTKSVVSFIGMGVVEAGIASRYSGALTLTTDVSIDGTTVTAKAVGGLEVVREAKTDSYRIDSVSLVGQGGVGNAVTGADVTLLASPRAPVVPLRMVAGVTANGSLAWEASAPADGSRSVVATSDGVNYLVVFAPGVSASIEASTQSRRDADPLASAIAQALQ